MLYNNRNYPHPVLGIDNDYMDSLLSVDLNISSSKEIVNINPSFLLRNADLEKLIERGKAIFLTQLYCRGTMFRDVYSSNLANYEIKIPAARLNGEVELDFFINILEDVNDYKSGDFSPLFKTFAFSFSKSEIIAYAGKAKFFANKTFTEFNSISSIIQVSSTGKSNHAFKLDFTGNRIMISLSKEDYDNYKLLSTNPNSINLILSSLVLPALIEIFHYVDTAEAKEFDDKFWYNSIKKYKELRNDSNLVLAQEIIDLPINKLFLKEVDSYEEN